MEYHWEAKYWDGSVVTEPEEGQLWQIDHTRVQMFTWIGEDGSRFEVQLPQGAFLLERKTVTDGDCSWAAGYLLKGQEVVLHYHAGLVTLNSDYLNPF